MNQNNKDNNSIQDSYGWMIMMCATLYSDIEILELVINAKDARGNKLIDINYEDSKGNTALSFASKIGDEEKMIMLLKNGASLELEEKKNLNFMNEKLRELQNHIDDATSKFINAVFLKNSKLVKYLLENEPVNVNRKIKNTGPTKIYDFIPLIYAAENGCKEIVELLLKMPSININIIDNLGLTPLICAAENGEAEVIDLLLEQPDIDVNIQDYSNRATALIFAAKNGHLEAVKSLLKHFNIDINKQESTAGATALMFSAGKGYKEIVNLLLKHPNIDVNIQNNQGSTALMYAIDNRQNAVIELLLKHLKININIKNNYGITAYGYAEIKKYKDIVKLLEEKF